MALRATIHRPLYFDGKLTRRGDEFTGESAQRIADDPHMRTFAAFTNEPDQPDPKPPAVPAPKLSPVAPAAPGMKE